MTRSLLSLALLILVVLPVAPSIASEAAGPGRPTVEAIAGKPAPAARRATKRKPSSTSTPRGKLKAAQARAKAAQVEAAGAKAARDQALARLARSRLLNRVLAALTVVALAAFGWLWLSRRSARAEVGLLQQALARAEESLDRLPQLDAVLAQVRTEADDLAALRRNDHQKITGLSAVIESLEAAVKRRPISSGFAQLDTLNQAAEKGPVLEPCPLLNGEERDVMRFAGAWAAERGFSLYPQASMGGFLKPIGHEPDETRKTFNSKRCDFVVCDEDDKVVLVIEHHGSGHFKGDWWIRDKVKRRLLNLARIGLVVTRKRPNEAAVRERLDAAMANPKATIPPWPEPAAKPKAKGTPLGRWARRA